MKLLNPFGSASPPAHGGRVLFAAMLLLLAFVGRVNAQVATSYGFTQSSGTFTLNTSSGTVLWNNGLFGTFDDNVSGAITIPSFTFNGTAYTTMYVSSNGFITFGAAPATTNLTPLSSTATYARAVSAFGADLRSPPGAFSSNSDVRWFTAGSEVVVQWRNVRRYATGTNISERFSFQIRLNTSNGRIVCIYSGITSLNAAVTDQPEVGLRGPDNTFATNVNNRTVTTSNNWATSSDGTGAASKCRFTSTAPATNFTNGLTYTWTPCSAPAATFTVVENCAGQTFTVDANVTSLGGGATATLSYALNGGTPIDLTISSVGVTTVGPFPATGTVDLTLSSAFSNCGSMSATRYSICPVDLVCGNTLNVTHCYSNNDTRTFTYTAPSPETVTLTFIGGTIDLNDIIRIYDGTDNSGSLLATSTVSSLAGLTATSLGQSLFMEIDADPSNSCATGEQSSWDLEVKCTPACVSPDGSVMVVTDCNTLSYSLDVEVLFTGDGSTTTLSYSVDGGPPQTVPGLMDFDVENIGPFALTSTVNVRLLHETQSSCDRNLGNFTRDQICAPTNDLCSNATVLTVNAPAQCPSQATAGTTFDAGTEIAAPGCDGSGTISDVWYTFNSGFNTSPIQIAINAGTAGHHGVEVYTACGGTLVGCVPNSPAVVNLSNATAYTDYRVRIFTNSALGAAGSFNICVSATPQASSCGSTVYDPGGTGNYGNNANTTTTYCPSAPGEVLTMTFTQFNTESGFDFVRVYDGPSTASTLLGTFSGTTIPGPFTSTHPSGCLTVNFTSDNTITGVGYIADLSCCVAPTPTAGASNNGPLCEGASLQLNSTTNIGTVFSWSGPNGFTSALQNPTIPNATTTDAGLYTVTVRNGVNGCPVTASTTVQISGTPSPINAGVDLTACATPGTATMAATAPTAGSGSWTQVGGGAATITNPGSPTSTITGLTVVGSPYTFRWTVSNAPCAAGFDEVTVTVNDLPSTANAGSPQTICSNEGALLAANIPLVGAGAWSVTSGPSTSLAQFSDAGGANATFTPAGGAGSYTLRWTVSSGSCAASTSDVAIDVNIAPGNVVVNTGTYAICQDNTVPGGQGLSASCPGVPQTSSTPFPGGNFISEGTAITTRATLVMPALPAGAVVTAARLKLFNVVASGNIIGNAQRQNIRVALSGAYTLAETQLTTATGPGTVSPDPVVNLMGFPTAGGSINLRTRQTSDQFWTNPDATIGSALIEVDYTVPSTVRWYDAPTSGTLVFSGDLFDPIGQAVVSNAAPSSSTFHATCGFNACESIRVPATFDVIAPADAGTDGSLTVCSVDAPTSLLAQLGGTPDNGGAWSGPSAVVNNLYDPATMDAGTYTYTVTGNGPCPNASATVTVTENAATLWYADQDGDGHGDPGTSQLACAQPIGYVANSDDTCPTFSGLIGGACDAGPNFVLGTISNACTCVGQQCTTDLTLEFGTDLNSFETSWELRSQGSNILVQSGGGWFPPNAVLNDQTCLPDGCFTLTVFDAAGDGMTTGGYILREANTNARIIDNRNNFNTGSSSAISGGQGFCLPLGTDKLVYTSCDKLDWSNGQYVVASPNVAVSAEWVPNGANNVQDNNSGYEFWIFDPNGSYSFRRFRSHNVSDGFGPASATRACHMKLNNWTIASHVPANTLMNVRIRSRVNGVNSEFGPACRLIINPVLAACPLTKLMDIPSDNNFVCGGTRQWGTGNLVHARPVAGANLYQFRFRLPAEGFEVIRTSTTYFVQLNWTTLPLVDGKTYDVDVRISKDGGATWCTSSDPWGDICLLTIDNTPANSGNQNMATTSSEVSMSLFPNPNRGDQVTLNLQGLGEEVVTVSVDLYDLTGKRVSARVIPAQDGVLRSTIDLHGDLGAGMYLVNITAGKQTWTERLVIQP